MQQRTKQIIFKIEKSNDTSSKAKDVSIVHNETFSKVNQSTNKGRWNKKEHIMFLHGIVRYGNNWKKIKELIKTRSNAQARSHGQKFFIKLKENKHFSFGPFINIKHFFNKIKGYNHSQKQLLFQELKAIPFDSDETCTTNENTFYNRLDKISNCFVEWRYIYEKPKEERRINFSFLNQFAIILMLIAHAKFFFENDEKDKIHPTDLILIEIVLNKK